MNTIKLDPLIHRPIIHVSDNPELLEGNVNGPSLIKVPAWVSRPLGRYYLYFAHHEGRSIRLAYADELRGPWRLHPAGALQLAQSGFPTTSPKPDALHPYVRMLIKAGHDGDYAHIASPDVVVDAAQQQIRLYYHGRMPDGRQATRVALSSDGLHFVAREPLLGHPYMRMVQHEDVWYGVGMPGIIYRSQDGLSDFEQGGKIFDPAVRHCALLKRNNTLYAFWTQVGHAPERILMSKINLSADWTSWQDSPPIEIHRPTAAWEGANLPLEASRYGGIMQPVNQLRDPAVFVENDTIYLLYTVQGEQGIAIGRLSGDWRF